jgi:Ca2+-binding RTX toxin-like protein
VADEAGNTGGSTLWFVIAAPPGTGANAPPLAVADAVEARQYTTGLFASGSVLDNDSDADGDPLYLDLGSIVGPTGGRLIYVDRTGYFDYEAGPGFTGSDSFTYRATDGRALSAPVTVTITAPVPNSVTANADSFSTDAGFLDITFGELTANDVDPEDDVFEVIGVGEAGFGQVEFFGLSGSVRYTAQPGFVGEESCTYTIRDAKGAIDTATVTVILLQTNAPPDALDDVVTLRVGEQLSLQALVLNDTDADGDALFVSSASGATNGGILLPPGQFGAYTPNPGFVGQDSFTYTVSDGKGGTDTATVTVNVLPDNTAPSAILLSGTTTASGLPGGALVGRLSAIDPDAGDQHIFDFVPLGNRGGLFAIAGDALITAVPLSFPNGATRLVTVRATDQDGASFDQTFAIVVGGRFTGTTGGGRLAGKAGDDLLLGMAGNDRLVGQAGNDTVDGGEGHDTLFGNAGADDLSGGIGADRLVGGGGNDVVNGGVGDDTAFGDSGWDLIEGGEGDDRLLGGAEGDTLRGDGGLDLLVGGEGDDSLGGGLDSDMLLAGAGRDTVEGGADGGSAALSGRAEAQRVLLTIPDIIDLRDAGVPDEEGDLILYTAGVDGVDLVRGFERGLDKVVVALDGAQVDVVTVAQGTWIGFLDRPGGILLQGVSELSVGTDILFA